MRKKGCSTRRSEGRNRRRGFSWRSRKKIIWLGRVSNSGCIEAKGEGILERPGARLPPKSGVRNVPVSATIRFTIRRGVSKKSFVLRFLTTNWNPIKEERKQKPCALRFAAADHKLIQMCYISKTCKQRKSEHIKT